MKKIFFLSLILNIIAIQYSFAQENYKRFSVSDDIEVTQIAEHCYVHTSYTTMPQYGRMGANGLIYVIDGKAALFDTPWSDSLTKELTDWIKESLKAELVYFIPNHWHEDCAGGLSYLNSIGVQSYANYMTTEILKSKNLPVPQNSFKDSVTLNLNGYKIICGYFGTAHAKDNVVVWIPSEKVLFPGCMAKENAAKNLGNTADGDLKEYPETIKKVINEFEDAKFVVPGHGKFGGMELLEHTLELAGGVLE